MFNSVKDHFFKKTLIILILILPCVSFAIPLKMNKVELLNISEHSRLVFSFTGPFMYHIVPTSHGSKLTIDFRGTELATSLSQVKFSHSLVKAIQSRTVSPKTLQIIIALHQATIPKPFVQKPRGRFGYRLVVDLLPAPKIATPVIKKTSIKKTNVNKTFIQEKVRVPVIQDVSQNSGRDAIVVIDPGHGGKDPGATGPGRVHEKNVVLAIGKALDALLKKEPHITSKMTRSGDYFVTLRGRLHLARKGHADLFIAIHADAYPERYTRGASVFSLSQSGATSEAARWLAQRENYSELGGVDLSDKSYMLRSVLIDLSQTTTIRESFRFGQDVVNALHGNGVRMHRGIVEQARFVVLKSPDIPSLLIETGFISNRDEERQLNDPAYQERIAKSIANGIVNYFQQDPPAGTWFAAKRDGITHVVTKGETIYQLSQHYGVSVSKLKSFNHIDDSGLSVGEVIQIPR